MAQFKQVIVLREDIEISKGKQISQACHASLKAYKKTDPETQKLWEDQGSKKVIVKSDENGLKKRLKQSKSLQIPAALVKDAGMTEVSPGTLTALGVGPGREDKIDKVTGELKLIK